jgi:hypothetical protein
MIPLQGTGCSEELRGGELLPKSKVKKFPMREKKPPSGAGVDVFMVMAVTGPSAGRCETGTGASSEGLRGILGSVCSESGRGVITAGVPSARGAVVVITDPASV